MKLRSTIVALFTGCAFFSPAANAFWLFQHRAVPVGHLSAHHHHTRHHHWHRGSHHRQSRTYRRIITEYRIYYVPVPMPSHTRAAKSPPSEHKPHARLSLRSPSTSETLSRHPPALAVAPPAGGPAPREANQGNFPTKRNNQLTGSSQGPGVAPGSRLPPATTVGTLPSSNIKPSAASVQHNLAAPAHLIKSSSASLHMKPNVVSLPATRTAAAADHSEHKKGYPLPIAPIAAAVTMAGLGYVMARKHKRMKSAGTNGKTIIEPDTLTSADQTLPDRRSVPLAPPLRKGFNYDEIRRVNVDRVFIASTPNIHKQKNIAAVASSPRSSAIHPVDSNTSPPPSSQHALVQHVYGETVMGEITELYNTPELKAGLKGFHDNIPSQFHDAVWVKVAFDGQNYAFAMMQPGLNLQPGDTVQLVFGQQDPPIPNRVMAVIDALTVGRGKAAIRPSDG